MEKTRVLLVDDDIVLAPIIKDYLESKDILVTLLQTSINVLAHLKEESYNICLLDVKMPSKSGFELAVEMQDVYPELPFIFLTGESAKSSKIEGFIIGADDYITKPFNIEELYLRINAVLKRSLVKKSEIHSTQVQYRIGIYTFKPEFRMLSYNTNERQLSTIESQLLQLFCESVNSRIDREVALRKIWKDNYMLKTRSLNVYISKLRHYFKEDHTIKIINIHGEGYAFVVIPAITYF